MVLCDLVQQLENDTKNGGGEHLTCVSKSHSSMIHGDGGLAASRIGSDRIKNAIETRAKGY